MALPEHAKGSWADVIPEGSWADVKPRRYLIGGNWKSNGDVKFVSAFPDAVLN